MGMRWTSSARSRPVARCPVPERGAERARVQVQEQSTRNRQIAGRFLGYGPRSGNEAGQFRRWLAVGVPAYRPAPAALSGFRIAPAPPGGMLLALAMNRRARGL